MKSIATFILGMFLTLSFCLAAALADEYVRGYTRRDGTYVPPHYRSSPDNNPYNNYSFPGNTNPYTGRVAPGNPDTYLRRYNTPYENPYNTSPNQSPYGNYRR